MKSFQEFCMLLENDKQPWYVAVKPVDDFQKRRLLQYAEKLGVPNVLPAHKLHCTVLYSNKPCLMPDIRPERLYPAKADELEVFQSQDGKRVLVAKLASSAIKRRHVQLMAETGGSYDYPEYIPHITLSYDIGDTWVPQEYAIMPAVDIDLSMEYCEHISNDGKYE